MTSPEIDNTTHHGESPPMVLLIDDCQFVFRLLRARLKSEAIELVGVMNGSDGLKIAKKQSPAIILLDLTMPEMDGFEVLRRLKDDPDTSEIPVIVLSGLQNPHDKVTAFELGAIDYITKPFELTELRVRIRSALRLSHLMQMLAQKAKIDGLTGLWNREYFDVRWNEEVERTKRHQNDASLAIFDLDHFKSVNDTFGHPAGDAVIQAFAKLIQHQTRTCDVCCRYGGEEFVIIMPETTPEEARVLCERVRIGLEDIEWPRHPNHPVTVSCGIAGISKGETIDKQSWLEAADKALYASKDAGRNRTTVIDLNSSGGLRKTA